MKRPVVKWLVRGLAAVIAIPIALSAAILIAANTDPGRRLIETLTPRLTGGMIRIEGIGGRVPDAVRLRRLTIADAGGVWLTVEDAALDWSPLRLISGEMSVGRLEAGRVAVDRQPASSGSSGGTSLPALRVTLGNLAIQRLEIGAAIAGQPVTLTVAGSGKLAAPNIGTAHLAVTTSGSGAGGHYIVEVAADPSRLQATLSVAEEPHGLIAGLAGLPDLGKIAVAASADGPLNALAIKATIEAGQLTGRVDGTLDPTSQGTDLSVQVTAPAMTPGEDIGWSSVRLDGTVHGSLSAPEAKGTLALDGVTAAGAAIGMLRADVSGNGSGEVELRARLDGLRLPGAEPDLLAGGTLVLDATAQTRDVRISVRFSLRHPLFAADGTADMAHGRVRLTLPDLTPFTAAGGQDLGGKAEFNIAAERSNDTINLTVAGTVAPSGGAGTARQFTALVGQAGTIDLAAAMHGEDVRLTRLALSGAGFRASATGQYVNRQLNLDSTIALTELGTLRAGASGTIDASVHAAGSLASLSVTGDVTGDIAGEFGRLDRFKLHLDASGLPDAPQARLTAGGTVLDAPLDIAIAAERRNGGFHIAIDRAAWKSLTGGGTLDLTNGGTLPEGQITLSMTRLADLAPIVGQPIAGQVTASVESSSEATKINAVVTNAAIPAAGSVSKAVLDATIADPTGQPAVDGVLTLNGVDVRGTRASARLAGKGKLDSLALAFGAESGDVHGASGRVETAGTLNISAGMLSLASFQAAWGRETIRLLAPTTIGYQNPITIDRLRLGLRQGEVMVAGKWDTRPGGGGLNLQASLLNLPADLAADFAPSYAAEGTIAGQARLTGDPAHPAGTVRVTASGLRARAGPGRAMPPGSVTINATLDGSSAAVDAKLTAGSSGVTLTGRTPLDFARSMDLRVAGNVDLAMLNPLLAAQGRGVKGRLNLALGVAGAASSPRVTGTARLSDADVQDASLGVHISAISAAVQMDGDRVRLDRLVGTAGQGTISATGTMALDASQTVDLSVRANNARILNSDLVTAPIDANLTLRGPITGTPLLAGTVLVRSAEIRVPEKLPPSVAVLPVRDPRAPVRKPPPPSATPDIALNLTLDAPAQVYIRGRGLDAELGGRITFLGTASHPLPQGGLHLRRGTFSLVGQSLNLTEGTVDFAGGALTNPPLKLVATSTTGTLVATLTVSGEVRNPKIVLSSVPDLPQDEILSQLLFRTASSRLSPFQVAQIAAALASISGVGPSGGDPLGRVRSALGLDQLSVGTGAGGAAALQAGRYVARGVRVGATRGLAGETQATVQIDIAKGLKLETTAGVGSAPATPTPGTSNGTGVGVTYQFEY